MIRRLLVLFWFVIGLLPAAAVQAQELKQAQEWVVSPQGPLTSIPQALEQAQPGDTIRVLGGVYRGNLVVDKRVRLVGEDWPVLDAGGVGMVVSLEAPGIELRGFVLRGSGSEPDRDHAGVAVRASDIQVLDNLFE